MKHWILMVLCLGACQKKDMPKLPGISVDSSPKLMAPRNVMIVGWGQSNMVGTGEEPIVDYHDNLKMYDGYQRSGMNPSNKIGPFTIVKVPAYKWVGYQRGPLYRFAKDWLQKYPNDTVYAVNCAESGTEIKYWAPGSHLFNRCVDYVKDVQDPPIPNLIMGPMLVMQGESDGVAGTTDWAPQFEAILMSLKAAIQAPGATVIYGQIGANGWAATGWESLKAQQASISMPGVYMVKTDDLPYGEGEHLNGHYTPAGYQGIANRMFDVWTEKNP